MQDIYIYPASRKNVSMEEKRLAKIDKFWAFYEKL